MDTRCMRPKQGKIRKVGDGDVTDGSRLASKGCHHRPSQDAIDRFILNRARAPTRGRREDGPEQS